MYIMIICHWAILYYNISFKTIAGRSDCVFWWFPALSEDQVKKKIRNHQWKLSCGFKIPPTCQPCKTFPESSRPVFPAIDIWKCVWGGGGGGGGLGTTHIRAGQFCVFNITTAADLRQVRTSPVQITILINFFKQFWHVWYSQLHINERLWFTR